MEWHNIIKRDFTKKGEDKVINIQKLMDFAYICFYGFVSNFTKYLILFKFTIPIMYIIIEYFGIYQAFTHILFTKIIFLNPRVNFY